jgi:hypothetical protein
MELRLTASASGTARDAFTAMAGSTSALDDEGQRVGTLEWGNVEVERGMFESLLVLAAALQLGSVPAGILAGVLANWLWSKLQRTPVIRVEVVIKTEGGDRLVSIPTESKDEMAAALGAAIHDELSKAKP